MNKLLLIAALACLAFNAFAESKEIEYQYDTLGRVTFVKDSVNGNRDYDYDRAGNRKQVLVGFDSDDDEPETDPTTQIPSGSGCTWRQTYGGGMGGTTHYEYAAVGPCQHSKKSVTTTNGKTTVTYE